MTPRPVPPNVRLNVDETMFECDRTRYGKGSALHREIAVLVSLPGDRYARTDYSADYDPQIWHAANWANDLGLDA